MTGDQYFLTAETGTAIFQQLNNLVSKMDMLEELLRRKLEGPGIKTVANTESTCRKEITLSPTQKRDLNSANVSHPKLTVRTTDIPNTEGSLQWGENKLH